MGRGVLEKPITVELSFISIIKVEIIAIYFEVERNAIFFYFGREKKMVVATCFFDVDATYN